MKYWNIGILEYWGRRIYFILTSILLSSFFLSANAQSFKATARTNISVIKIGEQFKLILEAQSPAGIRFSFPQVPDTITKLEIIDRSKIDTAVLQDKNLYAYKQELTVTCFDSGYYPIPPFTFTYQVPGDTTTHVAETEALLVSVQGIAIDTTQNIRDIKQPLKVPFSLAEALPYILIGLGVIALVLLIIYLRKKLKKKAAAKPAVVVPKRPPHEIALEELKKLESERLWQQGLVKQYHSRLTDIIRTYIEHRFGIIAMEMTTGEIMQAVRNMHFDSTAAEKLSHTLTLADMVKFAKVQPLPGENELSMQQSYEFVTMTKEMKKEIAEPNTEPAAA
jgi:hypothetical protein